MSLCASGIARASVPSATLKIFSSPLREGSPPPVASSLPSGLKASAITRSTNVAGSSTLPIVRSSVQPGVGFQRIVGVVGRAGEDRAVGAKATASTGRLVTLERFDRRAGVAGPGAHQLIVAAAGQLRAVGRVGQRADRFFGGGGDFLGGFGFGLRFGQRGFGILERLFGDAARR